MAPLTLELIPLMHRLKIEVPLKWKYFLVPVKNRPRVVSNQSTCLLHFFKSDIVPFNFPEDDGVEIRLSHVQFIIS